MEASRFLPDDEPQETTEEPEAQAPDLRLIGGLAVEQSAQTAPEINEVSLEEFKAIVHELAQGDDKQAVLESLLAIRGSVYEHGVDLAYRIQQLNAEHDQAYYKLMWVNGYIRDRQ